MTDDEFKQFFGLMHAKLLRYAMRKLDVDTANEAAIDTLRTIWDKELAAPTTDDEARQLQSLTYKIMDGIISNSLRAGRRRARLVDALITQQQTLGEPEPGTAGHYAVDGDVPALLAELSAADQQILSLLIDGYSVTEIATILDCTPGAASMRLARARNRLRAKLEPEQSDG